MLRKLIFAVALFMSVAVTVPVTTAYAVSKPGDGGGGGGGSCKTSSFLGFPAWYDGIVNSDCSIKSPSALGGDPNTQLSRYISIIALNIVQIMLMLVAYVSVGFIIFGGFKYLKSAGDSNGITGGKKTVLNAIIGLVLSFMSIGIVTLIAGNIK